MTEKRKLAAILAADVVGFSRLTGSDTAIEVQNGTLDGNAGLRRKAAVNSPRTTSALYSGSWRRWWTLLNPAGVLKLSEVKATPRRIR
jgi:hypothetical protein